MSAISTVQTVTLDPGSGERGVEVAGAEAFEVDGAVAISRGLDGGDHQRPPVEQVGKSVDVDLDASGVVVVPHTALCEPQFTECSLGPLDPAQDADRHLGAVGHAAGEA